MPATADEYNDCLGAERHWRLFLSLITGRQETAGRAGVGTTSSIPVNNRQRWNRDDNDSTEFNIRTGEQHGSA